MKQIVMAAIACCLIAGCAKSAATPLASNVIFVAWTAPLGFATHSLPATHSRWLQRIRLVRQFPDPGKARRGRGDRAGRFGKRYSDAEWIASIIWFTLS